jgi:(p)ppGpp synthase/HD superfamily hydrolase
MRGGKGGMNASEMLKLKSMHIAPYIQLATALIGKRRKGGGNMFRHQMDTMGILIDYGYFDSVLLKASMIHDLVEDVPEVDRDAIVAVDEEGPEVYKLVLEVTRRPVETKSEFLVRILKFGSSNSKILKTADRISNMISLGYVTDIEFVKRYTDETVEYIFPIARQANRSMFEELNELVRTRRDFLKMCFNV